MNIFSIKKDKTGRKKLYFFNWNICGYVSNTQKLMNKLNQLEKSISSAKELSAFSVILDELQIIPKKHSYTTEKITVILSADDNYSSFLSITATSILYNTNSFIEFYILSDGITEKNKERIRNGLNEISNYFSITFLDCNSQKLFKNISLPADYHVKLNTCNRLLFPKLAPSVDRAIYLDIDTICLKDISELWNFDLKGKILGAIPLYLDRYSTVESFLNKLSIDKSNYIYFNSGVLLIDYKKWREIKGSNLKIIQELFSIIQEINPTVVPDELVLNKFASQNGGYEKLPIQYNVYPTYCSWIYLNRYKQNLSKAEYKCLADYEKNITYVNSRDEINQFSFQNTIIRHFFGPEKPWNSIAQITYPAPIMSNFKDFWFYAKMTPYFQEICEFFIKNHLIK